MKNKGFLLSLFIAGSLTANAQDIKEWLSLTPIKMLPELLHCRLVPAALPAPEGRCPCRLRTAPRPSSHR